MVNGRDIDHIAVGPGGVLAIESKWRGSERSSRDWAQQARGQVAEAARVTRNLVRQEAGHPEDVIPVLIEWGPGAHQRGVEEVDGVVSVSGRNLDSFENWLAKERLDRERASSIGEALAGFLDRQIDQAS